MKGRGEFSLTGCDTFPNIFPCPLGAPNGTDGMLAETPATGCCGLRSPLGPWRVAGILEATGCCRGIELA